MSRTDHHRPWRIRAADRTITNSPAYYWHDERAHLSSGDCHDNCGWTLPHWYLAGVPRWYVHGVWWGPERTREREYLRRLAVEFTTHGDLLDDDFACYQHRHCAAGRYW